MFLHSVPHHRNRPTSRNPFKVLCKYVGSRSARGRAPTYTKTSRSTMHQTSNTYANGAAETLQKGTSHLCTPNRETTKKIDPKSRGRPVRPRPRDSPRERPDSDRGHRPDRPATLLSVPERLSTLLLRSHSSSARAFGSFRSRPRRWRRALSRARRFPFFSPPDLVLAKELIVI